MSTPRSVSFRYSSPPAVVAGLLCDAAFLRERSREAGDLNIEVTVEPVRDGVRVATKRERKSSIPDFARKLIGNQNRVIDETTWRSDSNGFSATYTITIEGAPVSIQGHTRLLPVGDGCDYESQFEVTARVPLLSRRVEAAVADQVEETLREFARRNEARLSTIPPPPYPEA